MVDFEIFLRWLTVNRLTDAFFSAVAGQHKTQEFFKFCLNEKHNCKSFIAAAFFWHKTIQGPAFWLEVNENWMDFINDFE